MAELKPIRTDGQNKAKPLQPVSAAKPVAPTPKPIQPAPAAKPIQPVPKPVQAAPEEKPVAPAPKPIKPIPAAKPIAPAPKPVTSTPVAKPIAPAKDEAEGRNVAEAESKEDTVQTKHEDGAIIEGPSENIKQSARQEQPKVEEAGQPEQPVKKVFKFRCSNCQNLIEATADIEVVECAACGKTFRNPRYVKPEVAEQKPTQPTPKPLAPAPKPLAPAPKPLTPAPVVTGTVEKEEPKRKGRAKESAPQDEQGSYFTGHSFKFFLINILNGLQILFTLGLGTPWAQCRMMRWRWQNTVIDGKRLTFDGKGSEIFGRWFGWTLLTMITLGIYGFWKKTKMEAYMTEHIHVEGEENAPSVFTSEVETYAGASLLCTLITIATLGFGFSAAVCRMLRWDCNHKIVSGYHLAFEGKAGRLFGKLIVWWLLILVTIYIASFFMPRQVMKWITKNMHFKECSTPDGE